MLLQHELEEDHGPQQNLYFTGGSGGLWFQQYQIQIQIQFLYFREPFIKS